MTNPSPSGSGEKMSANLQRSLKYYQKGILNPEAWFKIVEEDYRNILNAIHWPKIFSSKGAEYQLLDIGCGTGRFPKMVRSVLPQDIRIQYDLLDPSHYCLSTCRENLHLPFQPRNTWQTTLEHAEPFVSNGEYHIVWAVQSLYCLNHHVLKEAMSILLHAIHASRGTVLIVLAKRDSFFSNVQRLFFQQSSAPAPPTLSDIRRCPPMSGTTWGKKCH